MSFSLLKTLGLRQRPSVISVAFCFCLVPEKVCFPFLSSYLLVGFSVCTGFSVMSGALRESATSCKDSSTGPDFFSYYNCQIQHLLENDDFVPTFDTSKLTEGKCGNVSDGKKSVDNSSNGAGSPFGGSLEATLSDFKRGRLSSLLLQTFKDLNDEVEGEVLPSILNMHQLKYQLRSKLGLEVDGEAGKVLPEELNMSSSVGVAANCNPTASGPSEQANKDLQLLLDGDSAMVKEVVNKYSDELSSMLANMEQKLEELLRFVMSKCRPMTLAEKEQLQKLIQKLPEENLGRVADIVQHKKPAEERGSGGIFVDLDGEENITLWWLYVYVNKVEKAERSRSLCHDLLAS